MYEQTYHLNGEPFRLSPDPGFVYEHKAYLKAHAYMTYAFMRAEGFVMITGRPGTGKTTIISALLAKLDAQTVTAANLVCTQLQADDLLKMVAWEFGVDPSVVSKGELLDRLARRLRGWKREGRRALLIVDEAQDLSLSAMEELRLLTNIQEQARPLIQIFLLGQPQLRELILRPELEQVHQRIIAATHLQGLGEADTRAYIRHRLSVVGWRGDPALSEPLYSLIHRFSAGVPRRINLICSRLLLHCAVEGQHRVGVADLRQVLEELQGEELAVEGGLVARDFQVEDIFPEEEASNAVPVETNGPLPQEEGGEVEDDAAAGEVAHGTADPGPTQASPSHLRVVAGQQGPGRATEWVSTGESRAVFQARQSEAAGRVAQPQYWPQTPVQPRSPVSSGKEKPARAGSADAEPVENDKRDGKPPASLVVVLLSVLVVTLVMILREGYL